MVLKHNYCLQSLNTFGLSASAERFAIFKSINELQNLLKQISDPVFILGGGSNILITQDIKGTVLKNEIKGISVIKEDEHEATIKVGGGIVWHDFVMWSIENNLGGIENLSLIPGSVGAAPMQNIGAYGTEIKSVFIELEAVKISNKKVYKFNNKDCQFNYRQSIFKGQLKGKYVICNVTFKLSKKPNLNTSYGEIENELKIMNTPPSIKSISQAVINIRQRKLPNPKEIGNCGSFFKNPIISNVKFEFLKLKFPKIIGYPNGKDKTKVAAGWLIEQAGWKGYTNKGAGVHKNQALVLVNYGKAKGQDILKLSKDIQESIHNKFGIYLEAEVNIV